MVISIYPLFLLSIPIEKDRIQATILEKLLMMIYFYNRDTGEPSDCAEAKLFAIMSSDNAGL